MMRFIGLFDEPETKRVAIELLSHYRVESPNWRVRYIVFAYKPNESYQKLGVQYMTFDHMARFLVEVRGQCWIETGIGVASSHPQWDPLMKEVFAIANNQSIPCEERQAQMLALLR